MLTPSDHSTMVSTVTTHEATSLSLAREAHDALGDDALVWARRIREFRPDISPDQLARGTVRRHQLLAAVEAMAMTMGERPPVLFHLQRLASLQIRMLMHIAAAYEVGLSAEQAAADLERFTQFVGEPLDVEGLVEFDEAPIAPQTRDDVVQLARLAGLRPRLGTGERLTCLVGVPFTTAEDGINVRLIARQAIDEYRERSSVAEPARVRPFLTRAVDAMRRRAADIEPSHPALTWVAVSPAAV